MSKINTNVADANLKTQNLASQVGKTLEGISNEYGVDLNTLWILFESNLNLVKDQAKKNDDFVKSKDSEILCENSEVFYTEQDFVRNRWGALHTPHLLIVGDANSGRNFVSKQFINCIAYDTNDKVIIVDANGDYNGIGKRIDLANDFFFINPMDLEKVSVAKKEDLVMRKIYFLEAFFEFLLNHSLSELERTILATITSKVYQKYTEPSLGDLLVELQANSGEEARQMALALEIIVHSDEFRAFNNTTSTTCETVVRLSVENFSSTGRDIAYLFVMEYAFGQVRKNYINYLTNIKTTIVLPNTFNFIKTDSMAKYLRDKVKLARRNGGSVIFSEYYFDAFYENCKEVFCNISSILLLQQDKRSSNIAKEVLNLENTQAVTIQTTKAGEGIFFVDGKERKYKACSNSNMS